MIDYEDVTGPQRPDPEISRRIRKSLGLEDAVSQTPSSAKADLAKEKALRILDIEPTFPQARDREGHVYRQREYISKKEISVKLKELKELGYDVESVKNMSTSRAYVYFVNLKHSIEQGRLIPRAS